MKNPCREYKMSLETIGPVFVGDGKTIDKKSYIYTDAKHIEIIDLEKMYNLLQKKGHEADYEKYLLSRDRNNLKEWLAKYNVSQKEIDLIQQVDEAKLTPDKHIETKYGLGTIRNLSSGCKTLLNIVKHPDKVVNVEECGPNVLRIIFTMDNIKIYMSRPTLFDIPDDAKIRFNDSDIVTGGRGYNAWWSREYERREADDL